MTFDPAAGGWKPMKTNPMPAGMGLPFAKRVDGVWRYGMQTSTDHNNPDGIVHGGMIVTFADHVLGLYVWEAAKRVPNVTVQLNCHFLDAVKPGEFIELSGEVTRATRQMVFVRGLVSVVDRPVAALDGVWRTFPNTK